jgi:hypothetical protein
MHVERSGNGERKDMESSRESWSSNEERTGTAATMRRGTEASGRGWKRVVRARRCQVKKGRGF